MKSTPIRKGTKNAVRADRHSVSIPVALGSKHGLVKNISATGIYFEIDHQQSLGADIDFVIDLDTPGGPIKVQCHGTIVRLEEKSGRIGIAATISESTFKS